MSNPRLRCLLLWIALPLLAAGAHTNRFILDASIRHQTIDNFGANDAWYMDRIGMEWSETKKNRIADLLFSTNQGIGLSCWRFYLGAGINRQTIASPWRTAETFEVSPGQYDWNRLGGGRWFLRAAKARGVRQFCLTVYSPPARLTRNGLTNLGDDHTSTTNLKPGAEEDFAKYLTDILRHFRDNPDEGERINFDYVLPINEPQWDWNKNQEGCRASNADIVRLVQTLKRQLVEAGLTTQILGPESGSIPDMTGLNTTVSKKFGADYGNYLGLICGTPEVAKCFNRVISYHSYWSDDVSTQLVAHRKTLGEAMRAFPDWRIWQTEYCIMEPGRDLGIDSALRMARVVHHDLTVVNASAWQWWLALGNENYKSALLYTDFRRPGSEQSLYPSKLFWALGNYSRFIRPGMIRIGIAAPQAGDELLVSAFSHPANGQIIVVMVNPSNTERLVELEAAEGSSLPGHFSALVTSTTQNLEPGAQMNTGRAYAVPAKSVVTLVSESVR